MKFVLLHRFESLLTSGGMSMLTCFLSIRLSFIILYGYMAVFSIKREILLTFYFAEPRAPSR